MATENIKKWRLAVCLICAALACRTVDGEISWGLETELPKLPKDVPERGDVELTPSASTSVIALAGPELNFMEARSYEMFLIGPEDVEIEEAIFEMENIPVKSSWATYFVKELFTDTGEWRFANYNTLFRNWLVLDSNKDRKSIARGTLNIEASDEYEVEVLVFQGSANDRVCAVQISINGRSQVLGTKGPGTARVWEKWGMINLNRGEHEIVLGLVPDSRRGEIGGVRLRKTSGMSISSVKGLKITFGRQDNPDYYNASPPVGHFETKDLASSLRYGFRNRLSRSTEGRNICAVSISSASTGVLHVDSLKISFVTSDQKLAEKKASQFILIYPDGNSSRAFSFEELKIFASYVQRTMDSVKGWKRNPFKFIHLCGLVKQLSMKCQEETAKQIQAEFGTKYIELALEEAEKLVRSFQGYADDWPKPVDFPDKWAEALVIWYRGGLDENRLTDDGGYLDPWGNRYILKYLPKEKRVEIRSYGPDGKDDGGVGDDIKAEAELEWFR